RQRTWRPREYQAACARPDAEVSGTPGQGDYSGDRSEAIRGASMKERGILFTPENYDKSERGVKTQTRRIVKWPSWMQYSDKLVASMQKPYTGMAWYR